MEIKIVITERNKEQVLKLIDQLVEWEAKGIAEKQLTEKLAKSNEHLEEKDFLSEISEEGLRVAEPEIEKSSFGSWGMFNSYTPGKAALRLLTNLLSKNRESSVKFSYLIDECMMNFSRAGLYKYRGFPKKNSDSARGRLAEHLLVPFSEMGLMKVYGDKKDRQVMITREGLAFAKLQNPLLDEKGKTRPLSEEESKWLVEHLKKIDKLGYKEFSVLKSLTEFSATAKREFEDIVGWFKNNQSFVEWLKNGSRYENDPKAFSRQLDNVSRTFASGKIALLRELGIISNIRATYRVLQNFWEESRNAI